MDLFFFCQQNLKNFNFFLKWKFRENIDIRTSSHTKTFFNIKSSDLILSYHRRLVAENHIFSTPWPLLVIFIDLYICVLFQPTTCSTWPKDSFIHAKLQKPFYVKPELKGRTWQIQLTLLYFTHIVKIQHLI